MFLDTNGTLQVLGHADEYNLIRRKYWNTLVIQMRIQGKQGHNIEVIVENSKQISDLNSISQLPMPGDRSNFNTH